MRYEPTSCGQNEEYFEERKSITNRTIEQSELASFHPPPKKKKITKKISKKKLKNHNFSQFHETLPRSTLQMHLISVRFYEIAISREMTSKKKYPYFTNATKKVNQQDYL